MFFEAPREICDQVGSLVSVVRRRRIVHLPTGRYLDGPGSLEEKRRISEIISCGHAY